MLFSNSRYDIFAALDELELDEKFKPISNRIRKYASLEASQFDISRSQNLLVIAYGLGVAGEPPPKHAVTHDENCAEIMGALIFRAILIYTSTTFSSMGKTASRRSKEELINPPEHIKDAHKRLSTVRDAALAHYGTGDTGAPSPWTKEALVADFSSAPLTLTAMGARTQYTAQATQDLNECLLFVADQIDSKLKKLKAPLISEIEALMKNEKFSQVIKKYPFPTTDFFDGGIPKGTRSVKRAGIFVDGQPMKEKNSELTRSEFTVPSPSSDRS